MRNLGLEWSTQINLQTILSHNIIFRISMLMRSFV